MPQEEAEVHFENKVIVSEWRLAATSLRQSEGPLYLCHMAF
jgi:hypothetical protein